jgi:hypothetical protein
MERDEDKNYKETRIKSYNRKDSHRIEATEKANLHQANQGEIFGITRRQEKTVCLYRSSCPG